MICWVCSYYGGWEPKHKQLDIIPKDLSILGQGQHICNKGFPVPLPMLKEFHGIQVEVYVDCPGFKIKHHDCSQIRAKLEFGHITPEELEIYRRCCRVGIQEDPEMDSEATGEISKPD